MFRAYRVFSLLQPARPRHPVVQALIALLAVCAFLVLLAIGAVVAIIAMVFATLMRAFGPSRPMGAPSSPGASAQPEPSAAHGDVIDGEFSVIEKSIQHGTAP